MSWVSKGSLKEMAEACIAETMLILCGFFVVLLFAAMWLRLEKITQSGVYVLHGIASIGLFSILFMAGLTGLRRKPVAIRQAVASGLSIFATACTFFVLVPVTIERSVSVFLMESLVAQPIKAYSEDEIKDILMLHYICERSAIRKRMTEQELLGNVTRTESGAFILTARGQQIARLLMPAGQFFGVPAPHIHSCGQPDAHVAD